MEPKHNCKGEGDPMPKATLKIERVTLDRLKQISTNMEDTYDAIIGRLLQDRYSLILLKDDHAKLKANYEALLVEVKNIKKEVYNHTQSKPQA